MHSTLHAQLLGDFRLIYGDKPVTDITTGRLQSLLAYLLLHHDAPQPRQHLAFLFWPDSTEAQARNNLRQALHQLRHALPDADRFLYANTTTLFWQADAPFSLDVADFMRALAATDEAERTGDQAAMRSALEEAASLYKGDLLPSCYDEWLLPERERLREQYQTALEQLVRLLEEQRDYAAAIHYAQRLLRHDPLREDTYLCLMRLHALNNDRGIALRVYHSCATILERELGIQPSLAARDAYERLLRVDTSPAARMPALTGGSPLFGRQREWEQLQAAWRRAISGRTRFALVTGEAGIGKSRLAEELFAWASQQGFATAKTRAYAAEGRLSYGSVTEWLRSEALRPALTGLDPVWLTEAARLLPELLVERPDLPHPQPLTEYWQRQRFFEALARAVLQASQPLLLLIDDLQWCDQETLEWLHYLLRFDPQARLLVVGTARAEELDGQHPLTTLLHDLQRVTDVTEILLRPLDADETAKLATQVAGRELDTNQVIRLYSETEGNPLFVVETVRAVLSSELSVKSAELEKSRNFELLTLSSQLPTRVHAVIAARLAQLSAPARELASLAATIGRAFTFDVLARASDYDEDNLVRALDELWQRRIVREQGANAYDFSHDKIREVAYTEVSPMHRQLMHRRVAHALEAVYTSDLDPISGQIAAHYEQAGLPDRAIEYYRRAAAVAQRVYAHEEAIGLFARALDLLERVPDNTQRAAEELSLRLALAASIRVTKGWVARELGPVLRRAWELSQQVGEPSQRFQVLVGLCTASNVRGEIQRGYSLAVQLLDLAQQVNTSALLLIGHTLLAGSHFQLGNQPLARQHFASARKLYDPRRHHQEQAALFGPDYGVLTLCYGAHNLWCLGYPDQARQWSHEAITLAQELAHPFSQAMTMAYATMLHLWCSEIGVAQESAAAALAQATRHNATYYQRWAAILYAWIQAWHRPGEDEIARLRQALGEFRAIDAGMRWPYYLSLLVQIHARAGQIEEGIAVLDEAQATSATTLDRWWDAELHRLRGEFLMTQGAAERDVTTAFQQALEIARQQQAKSLELRAAMSLARLWQKQARHAEARHMLAEIYGWFSEGFDTPDLKEARALLDQL